MDGDSWVLAQVYDMDGCGCLGCLLRWYMTWIGMPGCLLRYMTWMGVYDMDADAWVLSLIHI